MTSSFSEARPRPARARAQQQQTRRARYPGIERLVVKGCDPRYELDITQAPLVAAKRFNIRLTAEERKLLEDRPKAVTIAINELCWDIGAAAGNAGEALTPMEKLLLKGTQERLREIVGTDPISAARQFRIKLTDVDRILLSNIRKEDLSQAIRAAARHMIRGSKPVIGNRMRLQQGRRGRVFSLCAIVTRRSAEESRRHLQELLVDLFDPDKALPKDAISASVFYYRDQTKRIGFRTRQRKTRRWKRKQQRMEERKLARRREQNRRRRAKRQTGGGRPGKGKGGRPHKGGQGRRRSPSNQPQPSGRSHTGSAGGTTRNTNGSSYRGSASGAPSSPSASGGAGGGRSRGHARGRRSSGPRDGGRRPPPGRSD